MPSMPSSPSVSLTPSFNSKHALRDRFTCSLAELLQCFGWDLAAVDIDYHGVDYSRPSHCWHDTRTFDRGCRNCFGPDESTEGDGPYQAHSEKSGVKVIIHLNIHIFISVESGTFVR
uniref:Uncharacterized protein n=1 Tax=Oryza punctata TaxID=4537 RepID=A0A0E0JYJ9_ORYPU